MPPPAPRPRLPPRLHLPALPSSYYSFDEYPFLWEPITCMLANVSYTNRVDVLGEAAWCFFCLTSNQSFGSKF